MYNLIRPSPMPEELYRGYLGRVININGLKDEKDAINRISSMFGTEKSPHYRWQYCAEELGLMAGMTEEKFIQFHTNNPTHMALTIPFGYFSSQEIRTNSKIQLLNGSSPSAFFCRECVSEDEVFHGFSYWRRDHHLPGQLWCPKHRIALQISNGKTPFLQSPSTFISSEKSAPMKLSAECITQYLFTSSEKSGPLELVAECINNKHVQIFYKIVSALSMGSSPLHRIAVSHALMKKAESIGMSVTPGFVEDPWLSDLILNIFPRRWLISVMDEFRDKSIEEEFPEVDGVVNMTRDPSTVWPYFLASAVLFDSASEALQVLVKANEDFLDPIKREAVLSLLPQPKIRVVDEAKIERERMESLLNSEGLQKLINPGTNRENRYAAVDAFYTHGKSLSECAVIGKRSIKDMEKLLRITCNKAVSELRNLTLDKAEPQCQQANISTSADQSLYGKKAPREMTPSGLNSRGSLDHERLIEFQN